MRYMPLDRRAIVKALRDYVQHDRNFRRLDLTTAMVAEAIGVSRPMLVKVMREDMGTTFLDYLNGVRLRYARHRVMTNLGRLSMEHIALTSGFASLENLNKKYKAAYGELPSATDNRKKQDRQKTNGLQL